MSPERNILASWHLRKTPEKQGKYISSIRSLTNVPHCSSLGDDLSPSDNAALVLPIIATAQDEAGQPPAAIRMRRWLKAGLRLYGVRVAWQPCSKREGKA
jgi:hypothetical protein